MHLCWKQKPNANSSKPSESAREKKRKKQYLFQDQWKAHSMIRSHCNMSLSCVQCTPLIFFVLSFWIKKKYLPMRFLCWLIYSFLLYIYLSSPSLKSSQDSYNRRINSWKMIHFCARTDLVINKCKRKFERNKTKIKGRNKTSKKKMI